MANWWKSTELLFRGVAILGALAAVIGTFGFVVAVLKLGAARDLQLGLTVPLTPEEARQLGFGSAIAFVGGIVLNLFGNTIANFLQGVQSGRATAGAPRRDDTAVPSVAEQYRRRLERLYLANGGIIVGVVVLAILGGGGTGSLDLVATFADAIITVLFGGLVGAAVAASVFTALWYGIRLAATEAVLGGFVLAVVFLPTAIAWRSAGFAIFCLALVYYNVRAGGPRPSSSSRRRQSPGRSGRSWSDPLNTQNRIPGRELRVDRRGFEP
ncbi:MAG: hypothetical protein ABEJ57_03195, partial [Halobacteriaceae archaeon]